MKTVDVSELKSRLSKFIREVKSGRRLLVTHRGQVVAELTPPGHGARDSSPTAGLLALARRNLVTLGATGASDLYPAIPRARRRRPTVAQLLDEERGDR